MKEKKRLKKHKYDQGRAELCSEYVGKDEGLIKFKEKRTK